VETWSKDEGELINKVLERSRYEYIGKERASRRGGGVGFLVKRGLVGKIAKKSRAEGLLWLRLRSEEKKIFIAVVYLPPQATHKVKEDSGKLLEELGEDIQIFRESGQVIVVGDFNSRIGNLPTKIDEKIFLRNSQDSVVNSVRRELVSFECA